MGVKGVVGHVMWVERSIIHLESGLVDGPEMRDRVTNVPPDVPLPDELDQLGSGSGASRAILRRSFGLRSSGMLRGRVLLDCVSGASPDTVRALDGIESTALCRLTERRLRARGRTEDDGSNHSLRLKFGAIIVFRTVEHRATLWEAVLPAEALIMAPELVAVDALLDEARFSPTTATGFAARASSPHRWGSGAKPWG